MVDACFTYYWCMDEKETEITSIRVYGLDRNNKNVCLRIDNFMPSIYIELPLCNSRNIKIKWENSISSLINKINDILKEHSPIVNKLVYKYKLYGAHIDNENNKKLFPYLKCSFSNKNDYKNLCYRIKDLNIFGLGVIKLKFHEYDANPILQLVSLLDIPTAGWIKFKGEKVNNEDKITLCDKEYIVNYKNLAKYEKNTVAKPKIMGFDIEVNSTNPSAMPVASKQGDKIFQISCVFNREGNDESCYEPYLLSLGDPDPEIVGNNTKILKFDTEADLLEGFSNLVRRKNPNVIVGYNILKFDIQYMIDRAKSPWTFNCFNSFSKMGFHKYNAATQEKIKWSSSAFKNQEFDFLNAEGRVFVDLLPLIQRDYKLNNYQLKTVSTEFLKDTKDDLSVKGIFKCYRLGIEKEADGTYSKKARKAMGICGKYCLKDSILVLKLMEKLQSWVGLCEMAKTTNISIFDVFTQGQQRKVYSQLYKFCLYNNIVVEKDAYITKENERYVGAHVFPPVPGNYERVLPFDFASLYPSTIIAYNIDYSTIVNDSSIPDEKCNVMKWPEHLGCIHDTKIIRYNKLSKYIKDQEEEIKKLRAQRDNKSNKLIKQDYIDKINNKIFELKPYRDERTEIKKSIPKNITCEEREYRFLKEPKGVIPTVLQNLLDARKNTRIDIKNNYKKIDKYKQKINLINILKNADTELKNKEIDSLNKNISELEDLNKVLDKRQLSYKVSANSMYGIMGVKKGLLPFMPGAMCCFKDSLISYSFGFTRKMKDLTHTDSLWTYDNNGQVVSNGKGLIYNGKREIVKITLIDGRTLKCTPDHKIMTTNGWVEAGKLLSKNSWDGEIFNTNSEYSKVVVGLELPEDVIGEDENNWKLLDYTMDTPENREKTLAFCRVLGFILADGSISKKTYKNEFSSSVAIGNLLDAKIFVNDIKLITGKEPIIGDYTQSDVKGNIYSVSIPSDLVKQIITLDGVPIGRRICQPYTLPSFLLEPCCPLSAIREFLGGLFGGDGTSPSLSVAHPSFSPIQLGWSTIEKYKDDMQDTMNKLINLLERFDMKFWCMKPRLARVRDGMVPKDAVENPRWEYLITTNNCYSLLFAQKIGFRYCTDKNNRLSVAASYQRYSDNVKNQHINLVLKTSEIYDLNNKKKSIKGCLVKTRKELYENEIPLHEYCSLSKSSDVNNHRSRPHSLKDYRLLQKYFPTAREYTRLVGCEHWFSEEKESKKVYSMDRKDTSSPCIYLDVVDVRYDGVEDVYDIIDVPNHSFIANGIVVHNCTTYMGRTNIEIVAKTIQEKYGGKLVYGDTDCVLATEPVLIKLGDNINFKTVEELSDGKWERINPNKEISKAKNGYQIWSDNGFTNIVNVVRCRIIKPLSRILTHVGVINCSNEHSLLTDDLKSVTPLEVKIGDKLCITEFPLPFDTPKAPIYNNKITKEVIEEYIIPDLKYKDINAELAFVWGLFFADGSCGEYLSKNNYMKTSWAINKKDNKLLERARDILVRNENSVTFNILDTMKSTGANKLVSKQFSRKKEDMGTVSSLVKKYRELFYDNRNYKKIPVIIFNSPFEIRQSFFMGYYSGDGNKEDPALTLSNKGAIGSAGLFYLMRSIGYKVSVNTRTDKIDTYKLTGSSPKQNFRYEPNAIKKIEPLKGNENEYIYDIQTENHHFAAGVGQLVVHNSNYITFPHLKTAQECWDYAEYVAEEVTKLFPPPISLAFEEAIYWSFCILTKKRYLYRSCGRDGIVDKKIGKKGVLLARRDSALLIRVIYEKLIGMIFDKVPRDDIIYYLIEEINKICSNSVPHRDYVITKSIGDVNNMVPSDPYKDEKGKIKVNIGNYKIPWLPTKEEEREVELKKKKAEDEEDYYRKCLPAVVQLAEKMRKRGQRVDVGSRLEYVIIDIGFTAKQYEKLENIDYFLNYNDVLKIDFMYYIKLMINPIDDLLNVSFKKNIFNGYKFKKDFIKEQYEFRSKTREKMLNELRNLFKCKLEFKS